MNPELVYSKVHNYYSLIGDGFVYHGDISGEVIGNHNKIFGNVGDVVEGNGNEIHGHIDDGVDGSNNKIYGNVGAYLVGNDNFVDGNVDTALRGDNNTVTGVVGFIEGNYNTVNGGVKSSIIGVGNVVNDVVYNGNNKSSTKVKTKASQQPIHINNESNNKTIVLSGKQTVGFTNKRPPSREQSLPTTFIRSGPNTQPVELVVAQMVNFPGHGQVFVKTVKQFMSELSYDDLDEFQLGQSYFVEEHNPLVAYYPHDSHSTYKIVTIMSPPSKTLYVDGVATEFPSFRIIVRPDSITII